jgi:hypothetical protein
MNISDYSTRFAYALTSIGALVDNEDVVAVTLNGPGKKYSQFCTSIIVRKTFPDFQDFITLLISEEMKIVSTSSNGRSQESVFYSTSNRGRGRGGKPHFKVDTKAHMVNIINMKVSFMEVDEETLEEEEVMEVVVEVIEANNQIASQTTITAGNLGTWQRTVIKRSMMHKMESYNKGIMHQLAIKVMNNCL